MFRDRRAATSTADPMLKVTLLRLAEAWPRSVPLVELLAAVRRARPQAERSNVVTMPAYAPLRLNDLVRPVLQHLDGQRDRAALLEVLCGLVGGTGHESYAG